MDFVVVGFGIGAVLVLLGLAARDIGPRLRHIDRLRAVPSDLLGRRVAWGRVCRTGGRLLALAGTSLCLLTVGAVVGRLSDRRGSMLVLGGLVVVTIAMVAWSMVYAGRYHPRPVRRPAPARPAWSKVPTRRAAGEAVGRRHGRAFDEAPAPIPAGIERDEVIAPELGGTGLVNDPALPVDREEHEGESAPSPVEASGEATAEQPVGPVAASLPAAESEPPTALGPDVTLAPTAAVASESAAAANQAATASDDAVDPPAIDAPVADEPATVEHPSPSPDERDGTASMAPAAPLDEQTAAEDEGLRQDLLAPAGRGRLPP